MSSIRFKSKILSVVCVGLVLCTSAAFAEPFVPMLSFSGDADLFRFGQSVALDDDTLVVGTPDHSGTDAGQVEIYSQEHDGSWTHLQTLLPSAGAANDRFGISTAINEHTIAVGASGDDTTQGTDTGAVYLFSLNDDGVWVESQVLVPTDLVASDGMAHENQLALRGDTLLVGAPNHNNQRGAVYVFQRASDGTWSQIQKLTANDAVDHDLFGESVALSSSFALIGADGVDNYQGAAYFYSRSGDTFVPSQKVLDPTGDDGYNMGFDVAIHENVAAISNPASENDLGSIMMYSLSGSTWSLDEKITSAGYLGGNYNYLGTSLALNDDHLVVGSGGAKVGAGSFNQGFVQIYKNISGTWTLIQDLTSPPADLADVGNPMSDFFGTAVAMNETRVVIGAPRLDYLSTTNTGAVTSLSLKKVMVSDAELNIDLANSTSATYSVRLNATPDQDVTISVASDSELISVSPETLSFNASNWSESQTVTITIPAEADSGVFAVFHEITTAEVDYQTLEVANLVLNVTAVPEAQNPDDAPSAGTNDEGTNQVQSSGSSGGCQLNTNEPQSVDLVWAFGATLALAGFWTLRCRMKI